MAKASPWHVLRPVLLAGAATLTWLTFSTSAATADSSTDSASLVGGLTSSVSSVSEPLKGLVGSVPAAAVPAPAPAAAPAPPALGLLQPAVGSLARGADQLVAALPVVNAVVPAGTVSTVSAPVAAAADEAGAGLVNAVAPQLTEAAPVLEPVLKPVSDLVNVASPLPVSLPDLPVLSMAPKAGVDIPAGALEDAHVSAANLPAASDVRDPSADGPANAGMTAALQQAWSGTTLAASLSGTGMHSAQPDPSGENGSSPISAPVPAGPSSGAGSGSSTSGSPGFAAWVDAFGFYLPLVGVYPISGFSEHAPSPVLFDPGSSPD